MNTKLKKLVTILKSMMHPGDTLSQRVVRSGFWVAFFKIIERGFRFIKTLIIARLLAPSDFGLFGIACLSLDILQTFTETGINAALIQKKEDIKDYLNTAWTIQIIRALVLSCIIFIFSPYIAKFFNNMEAAPLMRIIAINMLFSGFANIGVVYFEKEIEFGKKRLIRFVQLLVEFIVSLILAFILRNAWALVWGMLVGSIANCITSYIIHPYRPKLHLEIAKAKDLLHFGKWIFGSAILTFLITQGDDILVGKILGATALGFYTMAYAISNMPTTEITSVISQILFPAYSKIQNNKKRLSEVYYKTLALTLSISLPFSALIFSFSYDFTYLFLGNKWLLMVPTMMILAIQGAMRSYGATTGSLFQAVGKPKIGTKLQFLQLIVMGVIIYPLILKFGIFGAALSIVISGLLIFFLVVYETIKITSVSFYYFLKEIFPAAISSIISIVSIFVLKKAVPSVSFLRFFLLSIIGVAVYLLCFYFFENRKKTSIILSIKQRISAGLI